MRSSGRKRRSFSKRAIRWISGSGQQAWQNSLLSLLTNIASGRTAQDRLGHGDARPGEVERRRGKCPFVAPLFVPGPVERAHPGADVHLVDRRIEANPRETRRECPGIFGERLCDFRVLEVAEPGRDPEMAQVDDRLGAMVLQIAQGSSTKPQS